MVYSIYTVRRGCIPCAIGEPQDITPQIGVNAVHHSLLLCNGIVFHVWINNQIRVHVYFRKHVCIQFIKFKYIFFQWSLQKLFNYTNQKTLLINLINRCNKIGELNRKKTRCKQLLQRSTFASVFDTSHM